MMEPHTDRTEETHVVMQPETRTTPERRKVGKISGGGFGFEALLGIGVAVLGILGLIGVLPAYMAAISAIAIGTAFLVESGVFAAASSKTRAIPGQQKKGRIVLGGVTQALVGAAGIILGILALIGMAPAILLSIAAMVLGAGLLVSSLSVAETEELAPTSDRADVERATAASVDTSVGARTIVGVGAIVLGLLALIGLTPATLILVAMLALGTAAFLTGTSMSAKMGTGASA